MPDSLRQDDVQAAAVLHQQRRLAQSFGADPARYDRSRPGYPAELIDQILAACPGGDVLDVGIGTGTSARPFRARGCEVLGVEPDPRMAAYARAQAFAVEEATFEQWDPAGRRFDLVVAGQAWHWVDAAASSVKVARLLRADGRLAVFWNAVEYPLELHEVYRRTLPDTALAGSGRRDNFVVFYDLAADAMTRSGCFTEPERWVVDWTQTYARDQWLDQVPSLGGHGQLPAGKLDELLTGLATTIDAMGGRVSIACTTGAVTAVRR